MGNITDDVAECRTDREMTGKVPSENARDSFGQGYSNYLLYHDDDLATDWLKA